MRKQKKTIIDEIMASIEAYLIEKYGKIQDEWRLTLFLLRDNIEQYVACKKSIEEVGIFDKESYHKNPLLSTLKDLQATILKEVQQLGISPYASTKIGNLQDTESDNDMLKKIMLLEDDDEK